MHTQKDDLCISYCMKNVDMSCTKIGTRQYPVQAQDQNHGKYQVSS